MATQAKAKKPARKKGAKTVAREYFDALGNHDLDAAAACWKRGGVDRLHGLAELEAPGGVRAFFESVFSAFPDWSFEVVEIAASGSNAAVRWRVKATFSGPGRFRGLAPTGARVELEGCDMLRIENEKIVENNAYTDGVGLAQQLGMLPKEGSAGERAMTAAFNARTAAVEGIRKLRSR